MVLVIPEPTLHGAERASYGRHWEDELRQGPVRVVFQPAWAYSRGVKTGSDSWTLHRCRSGGDK